MQLAIARDYFPAYARLPRKAQNKADEFLRKFLADPRQASIHYEPIRGAQDKQLRSVRIGDDYRAIVRAPDRGDVFLLLWVDHHDEAYRWAASKRMAVHPATGTLQLFDLDAAAQVVTSLGDTSEGPGAISAVTAAWLKVTSWEKGRPSAGAPAVPGGPKSGVEAAGPTSAAEPAGPMSGEVEGPRLFASFTDEDLFQGGVPRVLLPAVRAVASDGELDQLAPHLPAEAAEVLTGLAAGFSLDALLEEILGRGAPKAPAAMPSLDPEDVAAALERPSTQQQFRVVGADFDLEGALAHPLDVWRVYLHPKQRVLARARTKGPMRVTGGAGTGKTVVALHRAAFLVREVFPRPDDRVLFTTFTVNLALDLRRQLEKLLEPHELARVDVRNIDGWAADHLRSRGEHVRLATGDAQEQAWQRVMDIYAVPGFGLEFCKTEWRDVIQAQDLRDEEAYVRAVRLSRGLPLGRRERRLLWPLFQAYRQEFEGSGLLEPVEILRLSRQKVESEGASRYRAVVVDETQDFSQEALRLVRALAGPEHPDDLFLVGDAHQRIYGRPITLGSAGIHVRGRRSQELRLNYRTTAAICRWSLGALGQEEVDDLDEGRASRRGYVSLREGQPPSVHRFEHAVEEVDFVVGEVKRLLAAGTPPEGICIAARRAFVLRDRFHEALVREGIAADVIERDEPRHPSVRLATMHRIKGLEFPVVFVVGVNADEVPYRSAELESEDTVVAHRAEVAERCLLYVAATRARDALYVTSAGEPSPFLAAMGAPPVRTAPPPARRAARREAPAKVTVTEPAKVAVGEIVSMPVGEPASVPVSDPASASVGEPVSVPVSDPASVPVADPAAFEPDEPEARDSLPEVPISSPEEGSSAPLDSLPFPTRLLTWAEKKGISTVEELVQIAPRDLLSERNLGRKTIAETRVILEAVLGGTWEEASNAAALADAPPATGEDPFASTHWDLVRRALPESLKAVRAEEIDLPGRVAGFMKREGLTTIGELATRSKAELTAAKNLGRASLSQLVESLRLHVERRENMRLRTEAGLFESWKSLLLEQDTVRRMVITRRAGLGGEPETLQSVGETLGISRERARQLENAVLADLARERAWLDEVRRRLEAALKDGAVPLDELAADPWWAAIATKPDALDYFGDRLLGDAMRVIEVDERRYLARCSPADFDAARDDLEKAAAKVPLPTPLSTFRALADALTPKIGGFLSGVLFERLRELLHIEETGGAEPRVDGFGGTNASAILALLRAAPAPVRVEELPRIGSRMPEEVLFFDRGLVGMEHHFPDFRGWMDRLVPPAIAVMARESPERQWLAREILDELREEQEIPDWLSHFHLASLLRRSARARYLGRSRFALLESSDEHGRIHYREELVRILHERGQPLAREDLIAELRKKTTANPGTLAMMLSRPPFLACAADHIGLLDRDLPGGPAALADALEHIASVLERRDRGLGAAQVHTEISRLSPPHADWPLETCLSVLRGDPRFRLSQSGAVGLSHWENVRVPSRAEIVRQCLDESDGHVTIEAVQRRIEAYYGDFPDRTKTGALANRFGAVLRGDSLVREADE